MARVLVTGAGSGLGLLTAQSLVEQGHEVVLHARATSRVEDHRLIDQVRDGVFGYLADLEAVRRIAGEVNDLAPFDVVIHNAGVIEGRPSSP